MTTTGLDKWYAYTKSHDHAALWDLLDPEAVFESPVVHTPQRGREITFKYLLGADKVLGGPGFTYIGEWRSETGAVCHTINSVGAINVMPDATMKSHVSARVVPDTTGISTKSGKAILMPSVQPSA